ncbi:MAG: hypothetical protein R6U98_23860, partial [Pirellulaceae bacterium]
MYSVTSPPARKRRREQAHRTADRHPTTRIVVFQAVEVVRVESCPTQAVLPLVGLAADTVIRDR